MISTLGSIVPLAMFMHVYTFMVSQLELAIRIFSHGYFGFCVYWDEFAAEQAHIHMCSNLIPIEPHPSGQFFSQRLH